MFTKGLGKKIIRGVVGDPNAFGFYSAFEGSKVTAMAVQPDGKIVISGEFQKWNDVSVNNICRINADLTLDLTFQPTGAALKRDDITKKAYADDIYIYSDGRIALIYKERKRASNGVQDQSYYENPATTSLTTSANVAKFVILDSSGATDSTQATFHAQMTVNSQLLQATTFKNDELVVVTTGGWVQKKMRYFNSNGTLKWHIDSHLIVGRAAQLWAPSDMAIDAAGNVWLVGDVDSTASATGGSSGYYRGVIKVDSNGVIDADQFGGIFTRYDQAYVENNKIQIDPDGVNLWIGATSHYLPYGLVNQAPPGDPVYYPQNSNRLFKVMPTGEIIDDFAAINDVLPIDATTAFKILPNGYAFATGPSATQSASLPPSQSVTYNPMKIIKPDDYLDSRFAYPSNTPNINFSVPKRFDQYGEVFCFAQVSATKVAVGGSFTYYDQANRNLFMIIDLVTGEVDTPAIY